jgi:hypothetical protein
MLRCAGIESSTRASLDPPPPLPPHLCISRTVAIEQVINSKTENTPHHLYLNDLEPYVVRRLRGGAIPAGARVNFSFDFLPGKVNMAGHSTPAAFGEPDYYKVSARTSALRCVNLCV